MNRAKIVSPSQLKTVLGYNEDQKITDVLVKNSFTLSAEIIPPRNGEQLPFVMKKLDKVISSGVDFLSVTKGAGGSLRGGSLPIAQTIKDHFEKPCIAHFTCRDLSPLDVENQLIDHHYFGVRNILALRGDPPRGQTQWIPHKQGYSYAYQLINQIKELNDGIFIKRKGFEIQSCEPTNFCIGAALYPEHPDKKERIEFTAKKFRTGADFGITQMIFDPRVFGFFYQELLELGFNQPVLPGLRVLRSQKQADIMKSRFGCSIPGWYLKQLPLEHRKDRIDFSVLHPFFELVEKLKFLGVPGVHIFVLSDIELCQKAIEILKEDFK